MWISASQTASRPHSSAASICANEFAKASCLRGRAGGPELVENAEFHAARLPLTTPRLTMPATMPGRQARDLLHQLAQDRLGEAVEILRDRDERGRPADHVLAVILVEPGFLGQDRQPVDRDAARDQPIAHLGRRHAEIGHAVAGNIDDLVRRPPPACSRRRRRRPAVPARSRSARSNCACVARTAAAKAAALPRLAMRVQPTVIAIFSGSDHSTTSTSMPPGTAAIASTSCGDSKARAMPSRCSI